MSLATNDFICCLRLSKKSIALQESYTLLDYFPFELQLKKEKSCIAKRYDRLMAAFDKSKQAEIFLNFPLSCLKTYCSLTFS